MYYVYFLQSVKDNNFYIGCTSMAPSDRLEKYHNAGLVKSTKPRRPLILIYHEECKDKHAAFSREFYLKSPKGYQEKQEIIRKHKHTDH